MTEMGVREFALYLGKKPGYVSELKTKGRLVLTETGKIDVEASMERIQATADPSKIGVVERHERERAEKQAAATSPELPDQMISGDKSGNVYQKARAMREQYNAMLAKIEYEQATGALLVSTEVAAAVMDGDVIIRNRLESLPTILAPRLAVETDEHKVRALLTDEIEHLLGELSKSFKKLSQS
jgi:hypothetical protein